MTFLDTSDLKNEEIALRLDHTFPGDPVRNWVPAYYFYILDATGQKVGMHIGPYDNEPATVEHMHRFMSEQGYALDISTSRYHHEIYLSDARKTAPDNLKTVIRHPIKNV